MEQVILDHWFQRGPNDHLYFDFLPDDRLYFYPQSFYYHPFENNLISLFGLFPSFCKDGNDLYSNKSRYTERITYTNSKFCTTEINRKCEGYIKKYYIDEGETFSIGKYQNDEKTGFWEEYCENEGLDTKGEYIDGKKSGFWRKYYRNGWLHSEGEYKDGEEKGIWKYYCYIDGVSISEIIY